MTAILYIILYITNNYLSLRISEFFLQAQNSIMQIHLPPNLLRWTSPYTTPNFGEP